MLNFSQLFIFGHVFIIFFASSTCFAYVAQKALRLVIFFHFSWKWRLRNYAMRQGSPLPSSITRNSSLHCIFTFLRFGVEGLSYNIFNYLFSSILNNHSNAFVFHPTDGDILRVVWNRDNELTTFHICQFTSKVLLKNKTLQSTYMSYKWSKGLKHGAFAMKWQHLINNGRCTQGLTI